MSKRKKLEDLDIKIVNLVTFEGHDGGVGINADIVYKGKKIAHVYDDARGGEMDYTEMSTGKGGWEAIRELFKEYIQLPKTLEQYSFNGFGVTKLYDHNLDTMTYHFVNLALKEQEQKKWQAKVKRDGKKAILVSTNGGESYRKVYWKGYTLQIMANSSRGKKVLQETVDRYLSREGATILNKDYLISLGINVA